MSEDFESKKVLNEKIINFFKSFDYRIVNLEAPITSNLTRNKINKTGPHLRMSPKTINPFLKELKIDAVTMANNHIMDYGERGLFDTIEHLDKMKIKHLGAGINLKEASKPLTIFFDKKKVAVLNFCENEWSIAQNNCCGSNPMDLIENAKQINEANESHDTVIVIIHGGHEYFKLPSPRMQKQYRFYADQGANLIVGHHTHCIGGYENYNGISIYYSLGNYLFTKNNICEHWYNGFILDVDLRYDQISSEIIPINQEKKVLIWHSWIRISEKNL